MSKKADISITTVVVVALALLSLFVIATFAGLFTTEIQGPVNMRTINAWAQEQAQFTKVTALNPVTEGLAGYPPVPYLSEPTRITSSNQIKSMYEKKNCSTNNCSYHLFINSFSM